MYICIYIYIYIQGGSRSGAPGAGGVCSCVTVAGGHESSRVGVGGVEACHALL